MLLNQLTHYKKFGIRHLGELASPHASDIQYLEFPQEAFYHYLTFDGGSLGPPNDDYAMRAIKHAWPVIHVTALSASNGNPRHVALDIPTMIKDYHQSHRRTKWLRTLDMAVRDKQTPIIVNYAFLGKLVRYQTSIYANYYRWQNVFETAMNKTVELLQQAPHHQHYFFLQSPKVIPSLTQLTHASEEMTQMLLKVFTDPNALMLLKLWEWVRGHDNALNKIPTQDLSRVNLIYVESGKWFVLNLGYLLSWRHPANDAEEEISAKISIRATNQVAAATLSKHLLAMHVFLIELRTKANQVEHVEEEETTEVDVVGEKPEISEEDEDGEGTSATIDTGAPEAADVNKVKADAEKALLAPPPVLDIDKMDAEAFDAHMRDLNASVDEKLEQLETIAQLQDRVVETQPTIDRVLAEVENDDLSDRIKRVCDKLAADGAISSSEHARYSRLSETYKTMLSPDGLSTMEKYIAITPEQLKIDEGTKMVDDASILDKSMLNSSLNVFDSKYITQVLSRDTAGMVMSVQKAGVAVTNYKVVLHEDILGAYEEHVVKILPVVGTPSTLRFKVPVVTEDGTFTSNGIRYRLRKQRGDLPIRKTSANRVALTSYYGKCFITRGRNNNANYGYWLQNQLLARLSELGEPVVADVFDPDLKTAISYSAISEKFKGFTFNGYRFNFDFEEVKATFPKEVVQPALNQGKIVLASNGSSYLAVDQESTLYVLENGQETRVGSLESYLDIDNMNAPIEYVTVGVFGKNIPLGVVLGMELGLQNLIQILGADYRIVPVGQRLNLAAGEYALQFSDESWVFNRANRIAALILGGFKEYWKTLRLFSAYSFDKRGAYQNLLEANSLSVRYVREIELMYQMFVDPITKDLLVEMKEPTTFKGLLIRSAELLLTNQHPDELDPAFMRIKGYERVPGAVYTELVQSIRQHNARLGKSTAQIEMSPYAVWKRVMDDPSKNQSQEINPIKNIKETEAVTFAGTGGRNKRSMTKRTRVYHPNDMGTISESTVDSSDVAINVFTCADPTLTSLRGISARFDKTKHGPANLLSTSALMAPGSDRDDPKRVNFIAIQQEHRVACEGYHQFSVRTGYDQVISQRTTDLFAFTAKKSGVVRQIDKRGIIVDYADGSAQGFELGRRFGNAAGLTIAHSVVTTMKEGQSFDIGDVIVYNDGFFEPDFFNPKRVVVKNAMEVATVLWESPGVHEDSSGITKMVAERLSTKITKVKTVELTFDQAISHVAQVGSNVVADSVLCLIQDSVTANNRLFDEASIESLKALSGQSPRAHVQGVVERIEVYYHGDKEDMSESLAELANYSDKEFRKRASSIGKNGYTGKVDSGFRIEGNPLAVDSVAIRFYITTSVGAGVGDKGVFGNQLKTVFGDVMDEPLRTRSGMEIHGVFGGKSVEARIVNAPFLIGPAITVLRVLANKMVRTYRGEDK